MRGRGNLRENRARGEGTPSAGEKTSRERILIIERAEDDADRTPQSQKLIKNVKDKRIINL